MGGLVAEGARLPGDDGIGFDQAAAFFPDGGERGFKGDGGYALFAKGFEDDEAGDAPEFLRRGFEGECTVVAGVVDARELFCGAVLAPAYGLAIGVDQDSM